MHNPSIYLSGMRSGQQNIEGTNGREADEKNDLSYKRTGMKFAQKKLNPEENFKNHIPGLSIIQTIFSLSRRKCN